MSERDRMMLYLMEEMGEPTQCLSKELQGRGKMIHIQEELGDVLWCIDKVANLLGTNMQTLLTICNEKVTTRQT